MNRKTRREQERFNKKLCKTLNREFPGLEATAHGIDLDIPQDKITVEVDTYLKNQGLSIYCYKVYSCQ